MNLQLKLEYYNILNSVRMVYLQTNIPFSIVNKHDIKLTYKDIKLKYIKDKNYFVKLDKSKGYKQKDNKRDRTPWTKEQKKEFFKQRAKDEKQTKRESSRKSQEKPQEKLSREQSPKREYTPEETAAYLERKARREQSPKREYTPEETAAYLERKARREQSPKREYTPEETAAYLERKTRREKKGGGLEKIMVFY